MAGEAPWVWEDGLVHAESGLAPECRTGNYMKPHTIVGKMVAFTMQSQRVALKPRAKSPDTASCLAWDRGHRFASAVSRCVEKQGGPRAEMRMFLLPSHVR